MNEDASPSPSDPTPPPPASSVGSEPAVSQPPLTTAGAVPSKDAKTMAMLCHLLGIFTWFIGPLVIWMTKKEEDPFIDDQGKEALNFQITLALGWVASWVLAFIFIGFLLMPLLFLYGFIFMIIATIKANDGVMYRYPVTLRLLK